MLERETWPALSLAAGIVAGVTLLGALTDAAVGNGSLLVVMLPVSILASGVALALGAGVMRDPQARAGVLMGLAVGAGGLVMAVVYVALVLVLPILVLLLFLLFFPWACSSGTCTWTCSSPQHPQPCLPCLPCIGGGSSSSTSSGGGCCGGGGGSGSAPATPSVTTPHVGSGGGCCGAAAGDRWAHHPDLPAYEAHVWRVAGARLCVGCSTTLPVFLLAAAALLLARPGPWWALACAGVALGSSQALSAAGLARRRWQKALVKGALGAGLAMLVVGVRLAPWPALAKWGALCAALGLALASALPRAARMRKASREGPESLRPGARSVACAADDGRHAGPAPP
ncbi:MAG: hypothetical protein QOE90_2619 [Thermoplasmata archaeon]|nr:hypothetical protein [Thermoplasmata archaeon]